MRKLYQSLLVSFSSRDLRDQVINQGAEPVLSSPEDFAKFMTAERVKWRTVIEASGARESM